MTARKEAKLKHWLSTDPSMINQWMPIVNNIYFVCICLSNLGNYLLINVLTWRKSTRAKVHP